VYQAHTAAPKRSKGALTNDTNKKRYEILYGEELIGEFYEGDVNRYGDPVDDQSMIVEFNECVQNLGKRRNRREWRLVTIYRYHP
jgi:hypothetical protein